MRWGVLTSFPPFLEPSAEPSEDDDRHEESAEENDHCDAVLEVLSVVGRHRE